MAYRKSSDIRTQHGRSNFGFDTYLNRDADYGLFEACNGNKYVVTQDFNLKIAVVLTHCHVPPFTYKVLGQQPIEYGQWWGPCRVRLTSLRPRDRPGMEPGNLGLLGGYASIDCRSADGGTSCIALGAVHHDRYDSREFDGWALELAEVAYAFFERLPNGGTRSRALRRGAAHGRGDLLEFVLDQSF